MMYSSDRVLVLQAGPERTAHQPELVDPDLGRLAHDVVEHGVGVTREEIVGFAGRDLGEHAGEVRGARLEPFLVERDAGLLEQRRVDVARDVAEGVVLHQHGDLLGAALLEVLHHERAEAGRAGVPVPAAHQEVMAGLAEIEVDGGGAAHHQELAVGALRVRRDALVDVGQERPEYVFNVLLLEQFLELDERLLRIALGIGIDQLELVFLAGDREAAAFVDLVDRHAHALRRHPAVGVERAGLRLDLAELDRLLRGSGCKPETGDADREAEDSGSRAGEASHNCFLPWGFLDRGRLPLFVRRTSAALSVVGWLQAMARTARSTSSLVRVQSLSKLAITDFMNGSESRMARSLSPRWS